MKIYGTLLLCLLTITLLLGASSACSQPRQPQTIEEKALEIYRSLMCPICSGQTIEQSQSELSVQMRATVKEKLEQGWSKEQIIQFFVERYGDAVLAAPSKSGFNLLAWLAPITGIVVGGIVTWLAVRRYYRQGKTSSSAPVSPASVSVDEEKYRRRLEQELKNFGDKTSFR